MITNARKVDLDVLYCGQGMANWIEIYDEDETDDAPSATILIDLGRDRADKSPGSETKPVDYIIRRLKAMVAQGRTPSIDYSFISHQDEDHWKLLPLLTARIKAEALAVEIGDISYGGSLWADSALKALTDFAALVDPPATVRPYLANSSDFKDPPEVGEEYSIGDVYIRLLVSNITAIGTTRTSIVKNATSAVMVIEFRETTFVLPGDATVQTLAVINGYLEAYESTTLPKPLHACFIVALPHHGSRATFEKGKKAKPDFEIGKQFAKLVGADGVPASAGYMNKHKHPNIFVFEVFEPYLTDEFDDHTIVAYGPIIGWTQYISSKNGKFTTVNTLDDPPSVGNVTFTIWTDEVDGRTVVRKRVARTDITPISALAEPKLVAYPHVRT